VTKQSTTNPTGDIQQHAHPCPSCGYCPTCGRRPAQTWPLPYQPWVNPWPYGVRYPYTVWSQSQSSSGRLAGGGNYTNAVAAAQ
jgi:hypothetical protein